MEYSSLFYSGLRATSSRPRGRRTLAWSSSSLPEKYSSGGTYSKAPPSARPLRRSATQAHPRSPSMSTSTESSRAPLSRAPKVSRPRPSSMFAMLTREMGDGWSSEESFGVGDYLRIPEEQRIRPEYPLPQIELDMEHPSAESRPFFVNLGEKDTVSVPQMREESLLLLSEPQDGFLQHSISRRGRPVSVSLPSLGSSPYHRRETRRERGDYAWMLEEPSPELMACDLWDDKIRLDYEGDVADWRQFHVDWLYY